MRSTALVLASLFGWLFSMPAARYTLVDLGPVRENYTDDLTYWSITDRGWVLGLHQKPTGTAAEPPPKGGGGTVWVDTDRNGFVDPDFTIPGTIFNSTVRELFPVGVGPAEPAARVMDMNESGEVVGMVYSGATETRMARWRPSDGVWPTQSSDVQNGNPAISGLVINDAGLVLSLFTHELWAPDGSITDLRTAFAADANPEQVTFVQAADLNDQGLLLVNAERTLSATQREIRFHLWRPGTPPFDTGVIAVGIGRLNNQEQAALMTLREVEVVPGFRIKVPGVVLWRPDGPLVNLNLSLSGFDLNDHGQLVGWQTVTVGNQTRMVPKVWDQMEGLRDLEPLVDRLGSAHLTNAVAINNSGEIVAIGSQNGTPHAFLLRPQLGLRRWWAGAGSGQEIETSWTVRLEGNKNERATASFQIDFGSSDWGRVSTC
jgi:hypothetical protein